MFEQSLLESKGILARRPWATAVSFALQFTLGSGVVLLSLICTQVLPQKQLTRFLAAPAVPVSEVSTGRTAARSGVQNSNSASDGVLWVPREIPKTIDMSRDTAPPAGPPAGLAGDILGSVPDGSIGAIMRILPSAPPTLSKTAPQKTRVSSGVAQGMLIRQVRPGYPPLARQARVEGSVVIHALIARDGSVRELQLISGHPLLASAALVAVRQWIYRPYYLNGEPVEVETNVVVKFALNGE